MRKLKNRLSLLLCTLLTLTVLAACGGSTEDTTPQNDDIENQAQTAGSENENAGNEGRSYPFTFTDLAGFEVTLDAPVETVCVPSSPLFPIYRYYAGNSDNLVGGGTEDTRALIESSVVGEIWPDIVALTNSHSGDINAEEMLAMDPDVIFMTGSGTSDSYKALKEAGLTVVCFPTASSTNGSSIDALGTLSDWLNQMALVLDDEFPAADLIEYNNETLEYVSTTLADVAEEDKPTALFIYSLGDDTLRVCAGGHYSDYWLQNSGAINVAAELSGIPDADIEQIMAWDPDIIYITAFNSAMPEDLYNNTFSGFDWSYLSAVQNKQVYKVPLGSYRWYAPSMDGALMLQWMAKTNHPELFADLDMERTAADFFGRFYGQELTQEQVEKLLYPSASGHTMS